MCNRQAGDASSRALWKRTHTLFVQALHKPIDPAWAKKLQKLKGKGANLPPQVEEGLFGYDQFLVGLGKMSLSALPSNTHHSPPLSLTLALTTCVRHQIWKRMEACMSCTRILTHARQMSPYDTLQKIKLRVSLSSPRDRYWRAKSSLRAMLIQAKMCGRAEGC